MSSLNQARLGELDVKNLMFFAGLDESRDKVRAALKPDMPLDYIASVAKCLAMIRLISTWEAARLHLEVNQKNHAEAMISIPCAEEWRQCWAS